MTGPSAEFPAAVFSLLDQDLVTLFADEDQLDRLRGVAEGTVDPRVEIVFRGAGGVAALGPLYGFDGFVEGWREWLSSFSSYRIEIERAYRDGERVIVLVRQRATTIHDGVEVPSSPSAGVYTIRAGVVTRIAFYMDREDAARMEGIELPAT